jgi:hypothetical protein
VSEEEVPHQPNEDGFDAVAAVAAARVAHDDTNITITWQILLYCFFYSIDNIFKNTAISPSKV